MNYKFGPVVRLLRYESEITLDEIEKKLGINKQVLSRFERNLENLSLEKIKSIFYFFQLDYCDDPEKIKPFSDLFELFIEQIYYLNKQSKTIYQQLNQNRKTIAGTKYYPLLYICDYICAVEKRDKKKIIQLEKAILKIETILPPLWETLFKTFYGINQIINGEKYNFSYLISKIQDNRIKGIAYFYDVLSCMDENSLYYIEHAKNIYMIHCNYKRLIYLDLLHAYILAKEGVYYDAYRIFKIGVEHLLDSKNMLYDDVIYLNLIYIAILSDNLDDLYKHRILFTNVYYYTLIEELYHFKYLRLSEFEFQNKLHYKGNWNHLEHRAIAKLLNS